MVSEDKLNNWKEAFQLFDKDMDGCLTTAELGTVMRALGKSPTEQEIRIIVTEVDPDGRGLFDFNEFVAVMSRDLRDFDNEADLQNAWQVFDKDGKGSISTAELKHVLTNIGEKLSPEEIADLSKEADPQNTGRVEYGAFISALMAK